MKNIHFTLNNVKYNVYLNKYIIQWVNFKEINNSDLRAKIIKSLKIKFVYNSLFI